MSQVSSRPRKYHLIYIPGLGDSYDHLRRAGLFTWRLWGVSTELVPVQWYGGGDLEARYAMVAAAVNRAQWRGCRVILVGESAGASLAINVASRCPDVDGLMTICGIANPRAEVSAAIRKKSPAFNQSLGWLKADIDELDTTKVCNLRAVIDPVVPRGSSVILGAKQRVIWSVGHIVTIALCLSLYGGLVVYLARSIKK
ncbi:Alpha/beta hydrolase family protein [compost metagenome]